MVQRFLKSGVTENGESRASEEGVPQGGSISPVLANVYLHYALDLWFEKVYRQSCKGKAKLIRYADDFVVCFQNREDATKFPAALAERLAKFGLEVEPSKTKVLEFGRDAERNARARGERPGTFEFLGLTHYCSRTKDGRRFRMKRVTSRKKFRAKLADLKDWLKRMRVRPTVWILEQAGLKLRGHYAYFGVTDNEAGIARFYREVTKLLYKWLNRRSQRRSYTWAEFEELLLSVGRQMRRQRRRVGRRWCGRLQARGGVGRRLVSDRRLLRIRCRRGRDIRLRSGIFPHVGKRREDNSTSRQRKCVPDTCERMGFPTARTRF